MKKFNLVVWLFVTFNITLITQNALTKDLPTSNQATSKTTAYHQNSKVILDLVRSPKAYKFLSYKIFLKEFIYTNSLNDYRRSLERISKRYNLKISELAFSTLNEEPSWKDQKKVSKMVLALVSEGQKKADFMENRFYNALENLGTISNGLLMGARIEIAIVNQLRKVTGKRVPAHGSSSGYFRYLLNHARYEVFLNALYCGKEKC